MRDRRSGRSARWLIALGTMVVVLAAAPSANATITSVFSSTPTPIPCVVQGNGVRLCDQTTFSPTRPRATVKTFDNVPIDVRVAFPPAPATGPDGPYPLIMMFHGYAGAKLTLANMQPWLDRGYAAFSMTTRGFGESCGTAAARSADSAGCATGYVRLMDTRYEVRDAQEFAGKLTDEGRTSPTQIGAIGGSYGGGLSMALGVLKNRKMLTNGSLTAWTSPTGTPMQIAAATPEIPWTDLPYSLLPNGKTLDYVVDAPYQGRTGVLKESWESGLYNSGLPFFYAPAGADPDADLRNWHTLFNAGEPYDDASGNPLPAVADVADEVTTHHSSYYIDHSQAPAPLLISNGWTDDLFPPDEAIRFYNRTRTQYPSADISLFFASLGHQRGQNKAADLAQRTSAEQAWMDYYVKGVGSLPFHGVTTLTQTCPNAAASGGPYTADSWANIAPGEVHFNSVAPKTILPTAGDPTISFTFDPISGGGACVTTASADLANTATYRLPTIPAGGYTLMGSPTVIADITSAGSNSQIAARLLDVDPVTSQQTLVARGLWRPAISGSPVHQVFQLHPNGYKFAAGHVVKLELLPNDSPYGRTSNGQANVTIQNLELSLPVQELPGSLGGVVGEPAPKLVPAGYQLMADWRAFEHPVGASPLRIPLVPAFVPCGTPGSSPQNATHPVPLAGASCSPPVPSSSLVAVGSQSLAFARMIVLVNGQCAPFDSTHCYPDVTIRFNVTDVRAGTPGGPDYDTPSSQDLTGVATLPGGSQGDTVQITDRRNKLDSDPSGPYDKSATTVPLKFPVALSCSSTADPSTGSVCGAQTTANTLVPGSTVVGSRAIWELGQLQVLDQGGDGVPGNSDDRTFEVQGVFVP